MLCIAQISKISHLINQCLPEAHRPYHLIIQTYQDPDLEPLSCMASLTQVGEDPDI
jgi:hypothetical protein